ncbi:hypothetical protein [Pseudooceanicola atlanticus]|uniref:hypothetical protein n=1 Tax=Pseudooceanicola atlanticus TaxID=1461694 RepID=UPI002355DCC9|nr:hypothetical protein [Pseudooceanicola atlanticus]
MPIDASFSTPFRQTGQFSGTAEWFNSRTRSELRAKLLTGKRADDGVVVWAGNLPYEFDDTAGDPISDMPGVKPADDVCIDARCFWGSWDGSGDDTAALQEAANYFISMLATRHAKLVLPPQVKITDSIDFTISGGERGEIVGARSGQTIGTTVSVGYHGYGSSAKAGAAFQIGDPDSPAYHSISVSNILFERSAASFRNPVFLDLVAPGQASLNEITFGSSENTNLRITNPQNCTFNAVRSFSGGKSFEYKDASAITVTQSGTTLTASDSIFSTDDVGKSVAIWGVSDGYRRKTTITAYTSATQVTVSTSVTDATARNLYFGSPFASLTSGSDTVTLDADIATAETVGLSVIFRDSGTDGKPFRATITAANGTDTWTLDQNAPATSSGIEFAVAATERLDDSFSNGASDNDWRDLHIEGYKGYGLYLDDGEIERVDGKIHANQSPDSEYYSLEHVIARRWGGDLSGSFDAQSISFNLAYVTDQTSALRIDRLRWRSPGAGGRLLDIGTQAEDGGLVILSHVQRMVPNTGSSYIDPASWVNDANGGPGYVMSGPMTTADDDQKKVFLGNGVYADEDGALYAPSINFGGGAMDAFVPWTSAVPVIADAASGGNVAAGGTFEGIYQRFGDEIRWVGRCINIDTTGMTGGNNLYLQGLPVAVRAAALSVGIGHVIVSNIAFSGQIALFGDNGDCRYCFMRAHPGPDERLSPLLI